jgi:hypothetical protein
MTTHLPSAVFDSRAEAFRAVEELRDVGVRDEALSVITRGEGAATTEDGGGTIVDESHGNVLRGILGGGALGAGLGVAALAIPGVGPLVAAGAIAASAVPGAAAMGAAVGAAAGTLNETLISHGVSEENTAYYEDHLGRGGVFVSVDGRGTNVVPETISDILYRNGGHNSARSRLSTY